MTPAALAAGSSHLPIILVDIHVSGLLTGQWHERSVGIVRANWFKNMSGVSPDTKGWSLFRFPSVILEENIRPLAAHELGHTYLLCDEYSSSDWSTQNTVLKLFFLGSGCPNGDRDDNDILDPVCLTPNPQNPSITGCPTSSLSNLTGLPDYSELYNFMGFADVLHRRWVANDSYNHLLREFSHFSPVNSSSRVIVSGTFNKSSGKAQFRNFYVIGEGLANNESELTDGNFSITIFDNTSSLLTNISFNMSFTGVFDNGNTTELNVSPFVFILPFSEVMQRFTIQENETIADERNRTLHTPTINIIKPSGGEFFSNEKFNISWTANDSDGDNLSYAILYSTDNGTTYSTIALDLSQSSYEADSLQLLNCNICRIKVLATDGVNTNSSVSNPFTIKNRMNITELKVVYQNNRERIFRFGIKNPTIFTIDNIWWKLNTGQSNITSQINTTLLPEKSVSNHVFYNYTTSGNYTVNLTVYSNELNVSKSIQIEVI